LVLGYCYSCAVLLLSLAIFYESYGTSNRCWMSNTLLYGMFIPPIAILLTLHIIMIGMTIGVYFSPKTSMEFVDQKSVDHELDDIRGIRDDMRASVMMLLVTMTTWILAILQKTVDNNEDDDYVKYSFLVFTMVQGVTYLFFFTVFNKKIWMRRWFSSEAGFSDVNESPRINGGLNIFRMKSLRHSFQDPPFGSKMSGAVVYDSHTFLSSRSKMAAPEPTIQQQWYSKKEDM